MSTLTPTQYATYANRTQQPDLLDAVNDTALADMRARLDKMEAALRRICSTEDLSPQMMRAIAYAAID